jgi:hypothetical protein
VSGQLQPVPGWRTWDDEGACCNHCCNKDRCDDPSHYDRTSEPGCPHCLNTGYALWTEAGRQELAEREARRKQHREASATATQGDRP